MVDVPDQGLRPRAVEQGLRRLPDGNGAYACPGSELSHDSDAADQGVISGLLPGWGPVRYLWEGHASDPELRYAGSSGGRLRHWGSMPWKPAVIRVSFTWVRRRTRRT